MSLAFLSAKKAFKRPEHNKRYRAVPYIYTEKSRVNLPREYLNYAQEILNKKLILKFLRKVRNSREYHGRGQFNTTMPGVYKNRNWRYFYTGTYNNRKGRENVNMTLFFNTKNGYPFFIHPITGVRKPINDNYRYFKNLNVNTFQRRLRKRTKYDTWNRFVKKASRYLKH